ncbi:hypothetical protein H0H92_015829 [Tricholoma furcatifolium]|nr:hypothetical protein H0H92_015829 [Tricholoma furcatifolium]
MPKVATSQGRATASSKRLHVRSVKSSLTTRSSESKTLKPKHIGENIAKANAERRLKPVKLSRSDIPESIPALNPDAWYEDTHVEHSLDDVLSGTAFLNVSHAGGEFEHLLADLNDEISCASCFSLQGYMRTRRDRTENRTRAFQPQMKGIVDSYMSWAARMGNAAFCEKPAPSQSCAPVGEAWIPVQVMDTYETYLYKAYIYEDDPNVPAALVAHGLLPTAPLKPKFALSIRVMELYRVTHLRCPHLTVEPFVKSLCDVHRIPFQPTLSNHFSIAFDLYLAICTEANRRVEVAVDRDADKWRLRNACSACTYKLEGERDLTFKMLVTMDGNDSLKRLRSAEKQQPADEDAIGPPQLPKSQAWHDSRTVDGDRYLTREEVNRWAKMALEEALPADLSADDVEDNPCAGRWTNMVNEVTAKMWGVFDETGVFLCLCRHGFSLVIADMVQSGELSKYPLAVVSALLEVFGEGIGGGYDIGCKFKTTLDRSELGERARQLKYTALVGSFHGHAHNRICQLSNLAHYVKGMGLEDLEGCKRFFSKSNHLAASVRYASTFHCQQKIVEYLAHTDRFETGKTEFISSLELLAGQDALEKTMADQGIASTNVFHQWLAEERAYLMSRTKEPVQETLDMEYYQKLVNYYDSCAKVDEIQKTWQAYDHNNPMTLAPAAPGAKRRYSPETRLRHAREQVQQNLSSVQDLELQLNITERWTPECEEWKAAAVLALKARSQAIRSALERYNAAAALMSPRRPSLTWDEVVEYAFLPDFDLLRDCREDVRERAWARPSARLTMDKFFRIERAREEIERLNIEIRRVMTHMRDEEMYLALKEREVARTDPTLAYHVARYREERTRFYPTHRRRFGKLASNPYFSGSLALGTPLDTSLLLSPDSMDIEGSTVDQQEGLGGDGGDGLPPLLAEEEEEEEEEEEGLDLLSEAMEAFTIAAY